MKKYLLIVYCIFSCISLFSAHKVYRIYYADTNDKNIGKGANISIYKYESTFGQMTTSLGWLPSSYPPPIKRVGFECSKENLLKDINDLQCDNQDIVIFVYCGHGARSVGDWSKFPQMCFAIKPGNQHRYSSDYYHLENVKQLITKKNPRLCIVIGDCCNSYDAYLETKEPIDENSIMEAMQPDIISNKGEENLKKLLLSKTGSIVLTASIVGEYGWCNSNIGMLLQNGFSNEIQRIVDGKVFYHEWGTLLGKVKENTYNMSLKYICMDGNKRYTQTPLYATDLKDTSSIDTIVIPKPINNNLLSDMLRVADDVNFSPESRISMKDSVLSKYFDNKNALVEVLGKDCKTQILSTTAEKYLRKISTEENLVNIVIYADEKAKSGKTMYLVLHEIYKEKKKIKK